MTRDSLMRVRIHRGAREIGGNCVELEGQGKRLVLDLGRPLDAEPDQKVDLPDIPGLGAPDDGSLLGVILSSAPGPLRARGAGGSFSPDLRRSGGSRAA